MENSPKAKKPLWRRIAKWTVRVVIGLVVVLILVWSVWNYVATKALQQEIAKIRAAGEPLTFRDLAAPFGEVPESQDAGPYYTAALALVRGDKKKLSEVWRGLNKPSRETSQIPCDLLTDAQRLIKHNTVALDMLDRGSAEAGCNYDISVEGGASVAVPRVNSAHRLAKIASMRTRLLAMSGRGDEAVESAVSGLRALRIFDRQPTVIAFATKIACLSIICRDVPIILESAQPSREALGGLDKALLDTERSMDLRRMCLAERVYALELMRSVVSGTRALELGAAPRPRMPEQWPANLGGLPFFRTLAIGVLRTHAQLVDAAQKGWPETLDAMKQLAEQDLSVWDYFGGLLISTAEHTTTLTARSIATVRSARVALIIERYRREHGKLPGNLPELTPTYVDTVPLDPFTGEQLSYRRDEQSYAVFSVGEDRKVSPSGELNTDASCDWGVRVRIPATQ